MQELDIKVIDKLGKASVVADYLLRLQVPDDPTVIVDSFPNEHLFSFIENNPWYVDIANYLTIGRYQTHLSPKDI